MDDLVSRLEWAQYFSWAPLLALLALLAVGLVYFLAPACGYTTYNRGLLLGAVWVLIAKMGLMIFKLGIVLVEEIDKSPTSSSSGSTPLSGPGPGSGPSKYSASGPVMTLVFFMLDSGLFVLALALFAGGLASLRREADGRPLASRPFPPRDRD
jgi:hypothetical protein